jgi:hypothetical protein
MGAEFIDAPQHSSFRRSRLHPVNIVHLKERSISFRGDIKITSSHNWKTDLVYLAVFTEHVNKLNAIFHGKANLAHRYLQWHRLSEQSLLCFQNKLRKRNLHIFSTLSVSREGDREL